MLREMIHDSLFLKHFDILSLLQQEVIINGQQKDESQKQARSREEVPHVVVVKKIEVLTRLIQVSKEYEYWQKNCLGLLLP